MPTIVNIAEEGPSTPLTFKVSESLYPGIVTLKASPSGSKFLPWINGVSRPLTWKEHQPLSYDCFHSHRYFKREDGSLVPQRYEAVDAYIETNYVEIVDERELRQLWLRQLTKAATIRVDLDHNAIIMRRGKDRSPDVSLHFCWLWYPVEVCDEARAVVITFRPTFWAQVRHFFCLKPWTVTICHLGDGV